MTALLAALIFGAALLHPVHNCNRIRYFEGQPVLVHHVCPAAIR